MSGTSVISNYSETCYLDDITEIEGAIDALKLGFKIAASKISGVEDQGAKEGSNESLIGHASYLGETIDALISRVRALEEPHNANAWTTRRLENELDAFYKEYTGEFFYTDKAAEIRRSAA